jgi:non-canonical purine NTP pyrophosphatase (RdgB/HAM1 family)
MKFITGNKGKFEELKFFFPNLEQIKLDLPEIQELNAYKVIEAKLKEAQKHTEKGTEIIIEDTSVYIQELNLLPGPFIKWFLDSLGIDGIWKIVEKLESKKATAKTIIGYLDANSNIHYFEGALDGKIVEPKGSGFGWDPIFQPNGYEKSFGEMSLEQKSTISMRSMAAMELKKHLEN